MPMIDLRDHGGRFAGGKKGFSPGEEVSDDFFSVVPAFSTELERKSSYDDIFASPNGEGLYTIRRITSTEVEICLLSENTLDRIRIGIYKHNNANINHANILRCENGIITFMIAQIGNFLVEGMSFGEYVGATVEGMASCQIISLKSDLVEVVKILNVKTQIKGSDGRISEMANLVTPHYDIKKTGNFYFSGILQDYLFLSNKENGYKPSSYNLLEVDEINGDVKLFGEDDSNKVFMITKNGLNVKRENDQSVDVVAGEVINSSFIPDTKIMVDLEETGDPQIVFFPDQKKLEHDVYRYRNEATEFYYCIERENHLYWFPCLRGNPKAYGGDANRLYRPSKIGGPGGLTNGNIIVEFDKNLLKISRHNLSNKRGSIFYATKAVLSKNNIFRQNAEYIERLTNKHKIKMK